MDIKAKTILVTGANGGIGQALCKLLDGLGARLVLAGHIEDQLISLKDELGGDHICITSDLTQNAGRTAIVNACDTIGGIDIVVNLAGVLDFNLFEMQSEATISSIININLLAPILLCHQLIPQLEKKEKARIINVGSVFGSIGHPGFAAYCASKGGLRMFTEALGRELADTSVEVAYIAPRATRTELNPEKVNELNNALGVKSDTPELVAKEIVNMILSSRRNCTLGWPERFFVPVNSLFPGLVHRSLTGKLNLIKRYASM